jgi:hypothetical protein
VDLWQKISEEDICRKPNGISLLTMTFAKAIPYPGTTHNIN